MHYYIQAKKIKVETIYSDIKIYDTSEYKFSKKCLKYTLWKPKIIDERNLKCLK